MTRIVQVSDSHLSPRAPYAQSNWDAVVDHVDRVGPDLVVHTGDISLDGADSIDDLLFAREQLDRLHTRWLAIPGNHDIGDLGTTHSPVTPARRDRYSSVFGEASWVLDLDGWRLIGVDVQTLASELDVAADLWAWLETTLATSDPIALFIHRPLCTWSPDEHDDPARYLPEPHRARLLAAMRDGSVRLIASGHVHQARVVGSACSHVWAPSTWASLPDAIQPTIGTKVVGLVEHHLATDRTVTSRIVQPEAMAQVVIGDDFASPYEHPPSGL